MKKLTTTLMIIFLIASAVTMQGAKKRILIESFTGTWCGPCGAYGKPATEEVLNLWPDDVFITELHVGSQDPFVIPETPPIQSTFGITGVPSGLLNREFFRDQNQNIVFGIYPTYWKQVIPQLLEDEAPCEVTLFYSINRDTRELSATVTAEFTEDYEVPSPAELRFNVYINENHIPYFQNGIGDNYDHKHICRKILGGSWGTAGVIPNSVKSGDIYTYTYNFTLDPTWNIDNLVFYGVVVEYNTQYADYLQILNVGKGIQGTPKSELTVNGDLFQVVETGNDFAKVFNLKNVSNEDLTFEISLEKSERTPADWTTGLKAGNVVLKSVKKDNLNADVYEVDVNKGESVDLTLTLTPNSIGIGDVSMTIYDKYDENGQQSKGKITALTKEATNFEITDFKDDKYSIKSIVGNKLQDVVGITADEYDQYNYLLDNVDFVIWNCGEKGDISASEGSTISSAIYSSTKVMILGTNMHQLKKNSPSLLSTIGVDYLKACFKGVSDGKIRLEGYKDDPISNGFKESGKLIYYLTPAFKVTKETTYPILKHEFTDTVVAVRSIVNDTRVVLFGINPYIITNSNARSELLNKAVDWLLGVGPNIECASTLSFEDTKVGETSTVTLTINNTGKSDLVVSDLEIQYDFAHIFKVLGDKSFTVPGGESHDVEIEFKPAYEIEYQSWIKIHSNAENEPVKTVTLSGQGLKGVSVAEYNDNNILKLNIGPNPVVNNSKLELTFNDEISKNIEIYIVDVLGQKVKSISNEVFAPGVYNFKIDNADLASGKYFIIAKTDNAISQIPMTVTR